MPTVSIIIATYNSAATIRAAIQSVLSMSYPDWELLVMDGASKDETCSIVRQYEQQDSRIHLHSEPDTGTYDAFNKGWRKAQGTWVHYLGSDDTMTTDGLAALLKAPMADDVDVVSGHCWAIKVDGQRKQITSHGFYGCHQGKLTRRTALIEMGGFDLQYRILADMDLYFRMRNAGRIAENRDCHIANFMMDGNSQRLSHQWAFAKEMYRIRLNDAEERHPLWHTVRYTLHTCLSILYRKMRTLFLSLLIILCGVAPVIAQHTATYDLTFQGTVGNGPHTAYYTAANQFGTALMTNNAAGLRAAITGQISTATGWHWSYGIDALGMADDYTPFYLQQLYANVEKYGFFAEVGAKEYAPTLRNQRLSSGSMLWSGNAHPIPQLRIGSVDFFDIPGTRHWLQFRFDGGYGLFMDDDYLRERYDEYNPGGNTLTGGSQSFLTTGAWMHQKRAHLRTNPHRRFYLAVGMEHAVQFGGTTVNYINNTINGTLEQHLGFMDFVKVLVPASGGDGSAVGDQNFVFGNHLGIWSGQLSCNLNAHSVLHAYVEFPFEDGSGIAKRNGWDGLWGLEYHTERDTWLSGIVLEYLQTTDQSGAIHWAPQDHMGEMKGEARGADEYYNNFFYCGYAHFGQSMGTPMLKSPIYNADSYLRFTDNRVQAWHAGIEGNVLSLPARPSLPDTRIDYRCLLSYRNAFGTMNLPSAFIRHDLSLLAELTCGIGHWQMVMAYACDRGSLMGDSNTFKVSFTYHGKVF